MARVQIPFLFFASLALTLQIQLLQSLPAPEAELPFDISEFKMRLPKVIHKGENKDPGYIEEVAGKQSRIVGGKEAPKHKHPSIVVMYIQGRQSCAGTILNSEWVLSASHCVISDDPDDYVFKAGRHNLGQSEKEGQEVKAVQAVAHEKFNQNTLENDIALFKVSPQFKMNEYVKAALIPDKKWSLESGTAVAAGWGRTKEKGSTSSTLQEVKVPLMTLAKCRKMYGAGEIYDYNLCAGYDEGGKDACQGDSGGPLYFDKDGKTYLIGVVSWGAGCARAGKPGVYSDVSSFLKWMSDTQAKMGRDNANEGGSDVEQKIVGGQEAPKNAYPSISTLLIKGKLSCGGTIVHEEWIVGAAHCAGGKLNTYSFKGGEHSIKKPEDTEQLVKAVEIHIHEKYDPETIVNDIALFKVTPPFKMNKYVQRVYLPKMDLDPMGDATVAGWGVLKENSPAASDLLMEVDVPIITNEKCKKAYEKDVEIVPGMLCAGYDQGGKDSCNGDSGGPLYMKTGTKQTLIGIVSFGIGCAKPRYPGVYTRVTKYLDWMEKTAGVKLGAIEDSGHDGKARISALMAESTCKQYAQWEKDGKILPPIKDNPGSQIGNGELGWTPCKDRSCYPFVWLR